MSSASTEERVVPADAPPERLDKTVARLFWDIKVRRRPLG